MICLLWSIMIGIVFLIMVSAWTSNLIFYVNISALIASVKASTKRLFLLFVMQQEIYESL